MIWTVMLWLGMQGQANGQGTVMGDKSPLSSLFAVSDHDITTTGTAHCDWTLDEVVCYGLVAGAPEIPMTIRRPPVEHVFEIRTKREPNGKTRVCWLITTGAPGDSCEVIKTPMYCPQSAECSEDFDVTRELWMDGVKLGTIKGLE